MTRKTAKRATTVAGIALIAGLGLTVQPGPTFGTFHLSVPSAFAQDSGSHTDGDHTDGGQQKGKTGEAGHGSSSGGHEDDGTHEESGGHGGASGSSGQGQGGPGPDSEGKGPQAGTPSGTRGTKPVWSSEGIPEVELGRLNVARSPDHVLQRAYEEALATISPTMVSFYNLPLNQAIDQLSLNWDNVSFIDSPLQNLALLKDTLDGSSALSSLGVTNNTATLEAIFLGTASDKTVPITAATVTAVTTILGQPVTGAAATSLAAQAEAVRIAVLAGHDG
ncbi:hypothetical protein BMG03_09530 [Thioclava nitratireducens]|uniref:Uncharacterized protein n=1 Tax=Thioclava nitratireducens TaxID=1915078 RepID=A0ABM6IH60_9RHOB|nr:hypothetical protein [Thioclava nitratireducens]AQS48022.1 hypothetical protein BMG03_09530 [Thioclava nitratireducens]